MLPSSLRSRPTRHVTTATCQDNDDDKCGTKEDLDRTFSGVSYDTSEDGSRAQYQGDEVFQDNKEANVDANNKFDHNYDDDKTAPLSSSSSFMDNKFQQLQRRVELLELMQAKRSKEHVQFSMEMLMNGTTDGVDMETGYSTDVSESKSLHREFAKDGNSAYKLSRSSSIEAKTFELPESTYTLLITQEKFSIPFNAGIVASGLSLMCLILVLLNELQKRRPGNPLGLPAGLPPGVRLAQYLGIFVGVLMENEIPTGLELIGKGAEQEIHDGKKFSMKRIIFSSMLRLSVGYLFLLCLFLVVVQESTVLGIFFDVLALEFVENIDDVLFALFRRGFFGRVLKRAANNIPVIETSNDTRNLSKWTKQFIRFVYVFNVCLGIACLTLLTIRQEQGAYRCTKILVTFEDEMWENAFVTTNDGPPEKRLLIFSHFNGLYEEDGTRDGRPRYIERSKELGEPLRHVLPAEISYCEEIESWVFSHENIRTSFEKNDENPCSWLMKSQRTESYDITSLGKLTHWFVWKGLIESKREVTIECYQCSEEADCNYNGECVEGKCVCKEGYFGSLCQFTKPCNVLRSEKDESTTLQLVDNEVGQFALSYGRPVYVARNMSGIPYSLLRLGYPKTGEEYFDIEYPSATSEIEINYELPPHKHTDPHFFDDDDFFEQNFKNHPVEFNKLLENYTFSVHYTGLRWYGNIYSPEKEEKIFDNNVEYHAFWDNAFSGVGMEDNSTFLISEPTYGGSPTAVDFYETRRRNIVFDDDIHEYNYGPFGVMIPLVKYHGSGFFHCNRDP